MICSYCGTDLPMGAMFCGECGRPVAARAATRTRARSAASSVATATRWPVSVAEHQPEDLPEAAARPPRKRVEAEATAHALVEPPRASDAVFAEPPPSARSKPAKATPDLAVDSPEKVGEQAIVEQPVDKRSPAQKSAETKAAAAQALAESRTRALAQAEEQSRADEEARALAEAERVRVTAEAEAQAAVEAEVQAAAAAAEADAKAEAEERERQAEAERAAEAERVRSEAERAAEAEREQAEESARQAAEQAQAEQARAEHDARIAAEARAENEARIAAEAAAEAAEAARVAAQAKADVVPGFEGSDVVVEDLLNLHPAEICAQCGAPLAASDIFCGVCGFVRKNVATPTDRTPDTVAYDPFPWGLPRATDIVPAEEAPEPPDEGYDDDSDVEKTRIVDRSVRGDRFVLQFSTGESVSVSGTGLIGRNPVAEPGEYFDSLVTIVDPGKSVSKTHLEFGQDAGAFWVSDRFSANGTVLREPDRPARRGDAGKRYRLVRGTRVDIGEQFFIVS